MNGAAKELEPVIGSIVGPGTSHRTRRCEAGIGFTAGGPLLSPVEGDVTPQETPFAVAAKTVQASAAGDDVKSTVQRPVVVQLVDLAFGIIAANLKQRIGHIMCRDRPVRQCASDPRDIFVRRAREHLAVLLDGVVSI